jgi:hypothetical protein
MVVEVHKGAIVSDMNRFVLHVGGCMWPSCVERRSFSILENKKFTFCVYDILTHFKFSDTYRRKLCCLFRIQEHPAS